MRVYATGQRAGRRRPAMLLLLLPLAVALLLPGATAVARGTFGSNLRVNHAGDGFYQAFPAVQSAPTGEIYVAWEEWRHLSGSVYFTRSIDHGASFEVEYRVDPAELPGYGEPLLVKWPCLAVDGAGIIYVAWMAWMATGTGQIYCARSVDQGQSFEDPVRVSDTDVGDRAWPGIAGVPAGGVHLVWGDFRNSPYVTDLYTSYSADGTIFSANTKATLLPVGPECTPPLPDIAVGDDPDIVHIVWRHTAYYNQRYIYACRSLDGGETFQPPVEVSHDVWEFGG